MANPFQQALEEDYIEDPQGKGNPFSSPFGQAATDPVFKEGMDEEQEGFWKSSLRSAMQPIQGFLETTGPGLAASFWQLLAAGELDHEEMDRLKQVYEKEGKEFPEQEFEEAREKAMSMIPTVRNLASAIEERTGFPLEPKTRFQKGLRFATEATRLAPSGSTLRPLNVGLPKPVLGAGVEATREVLKEIGVPEPFDELLAFGILKKPPKDAPRLEIGAKKKPSGLTERGFENLEESRQVSEKKFGKINNAIESDFKNIADDIIKNSPIGKTHAELELNPLFKTEIQEQFAKVQELADKIPEHINTMTVKKAIAEQAKKNISTNLAPSEYTKEYHQLMKQFIEETPTGNAGAGDLVSAFRNNNKDLSGAYDPVKSKNFNRAKKDALLDYNRAIAKVIEKEFPNTEFSKLFPETNKSWSQILDAEKINESINEMFKGNLNHNQVRKFFDSPHKNAPFKRTLGENYPKFEQLMKDLLTTEKPYKMLQVAKQKGFTDLVETASLFVISPKLSMGKKAIDYAKNGTRFILNTVLDKPKLTIKWHEGIKNLKKGDFKTAEKDFSFLKSQVEEAEKEAIRPSEVFNEKEFKEAVKENEKKVKKTFFEEPETLEVKGEKIKPEPSTLEKTQSRIEELKERQPPTESKRSEPERKRLEHKPIEKQKIAKAEKKTKIDKESKSTKVKEAKEKKKAEIKAKIDTTKKIEEKIEHAAERPDITKKGLQTQKAFILDRLEDAIKNPSAFGEKIDIDVPGDGKFKIHNDKKALEQFRDTIQKKWPEKALPTKEETYKRKPISKGKSKEEYEKMAQPIWKKYNKVKEKIEIYEKKLNINNMGKQNKLNYDLLIKEKEDLAGMLDDLKVLFMQD